MATAAIDYDAVQLAGQVFAGVVGFEICELNRHKYTVNKRNVICSNKYIYVYETYFGNISCLVYNRSSSYK